MMNSALRNAHTQSTQASPPSSRRSNLAFASDLCAGFSSTPKTIPCKYFYDEVGSLLFEEICEQREYYPTRTELSILRKHAPAIAARLGRNVRVVELGSGSGNKTDLFVDALECPAQYVAVDISAEALLAATKRLARRRSDLLVSHVIADYTRDFVLPEAPASASRTVVYFPGSTIGNFEPEEASSFLAGSAKLVGESGAVLLGVDLKKDPSVLHAAYNDARGITAAFNLNVLTRANREVGADFDVDSFAHSAFYNAPLGRIEMHLVSMGRQTVDIRGARFVLQEGEAIRTEVSHKYTRARLEDLAASAGLRVADVWVDERRWFAVALLMPAMAQNAG